MNQQTNSTEQRRRQYLAAMGIDLWLPRDIASPDEQAQADAAPAPEAVASTALSSDSAPEVRRTETESVTGSVKDSWHALQQQVVACTACGLHETRTQTVFGTGDRAADWLFVGEAPGADEDRQGEPFVGRAGQLLNAMIQALDMKREQVYIANVLKCRPPNNRDPQAAEVEACEPFLLQQIELIRPRIIVALGRHAAHSLLKTDQALGKLRGRCHDYHGIPLVVTYHPAYLLRSPAEKRKAWEDLCMARDQVTGK